jgi:hypothetical protein
MKWYHHTEISQRGGDAVEMRAQRDVRKEVILDERVRALGMRLE